MQENVAARNVLKYVLEAEEGERMLLIGDDVNADVIDAFTAGGADLGLWVRQIKLDTKKGFRKQMPPHLREAVLGGGTGRPDIFINMLRGIAEETPFRIELIKLETRGRKSRLGHCPGITIDMLTDGALALTAEEHKEMQNFVRKALTRLLDVSEVRIVTPEGTDLRFSVKGRDFFTDTFMDWETMRWMNLPTGEIMVGPVENSLNGILVCDMAIGGVGLLEEPVRITAKDGKAAKVEGDDTKVLSKIKTALSTDYWSSFVGELGIGVNRKARAVEEFLETEKIFGTVHIAFGNNIDYPGGKNTSANHMDFLMSKPSVTITYESGEDIEIIKNGEFLDFP